MKDKLICIQTLNFQRKHRSTRTLPTISPIKSQAVRPTASLYIEYQIQGSSFLTLDLFPCCPTSMELNLVSRTCLPPSYVPGQWNGLLWTVLPPTFLHRFGNQDSSHALQSLNLCLQVSLIPILTASSLA